LQRRFFPHERLWLGRSVRKAILQEFGCREGLGAGRSIPQTQSNLLGQLGAASQARDRAVIGKEHLRCNATEAVPERARHLFSADRCVDSPAKMLWRMLE